MEMNLLEMLGEDITTFEENEKKAKAKGKAEKPATKKSSSVTSENMRDFKKYKVEKITMPIQLIYYGDTHELTAELFPGVEPDKLTTTHLFEYLKREHYPFISDEQVRFTKGKEEDVNRVFLELKLQTKGALASALVHKTGSYIKKEDSFFTYCLETPEEVHGTKVKAKPRRHFNLQFGKMSYDILRDFFELAFRHAVVEVEAYGMVYYDRVESMYFLDLPDQENGTYRSVYFETETYKDRERYLPIMDIHSHHKMTCSFSTIDDREDIAPFIHAVIHSLKPSTGDFKMDLRIGLGYPVQFLTIQPSDIFEGVE